mgnify:CR=1 FL=1
MKVNFEEILFNKNFEIANKTFFISGNEETLINKVEKTLIERFFLHGTKGVERVSSLEVHAKNNNLFYEKGLTILNNIKGLDKDSIIKFSNDNSLIINTENTRGDTAIKKIFENQKNFILINCYELSKDKKINILNHFISSYNLKISKDAFWYLIENTDDKYLFFENEIHKLINLGKENCSLKDVMGLLSVPISEDYFVLLFSILKNNSDLVKLYNSKINSISELYKFMYVTKYCFEQIFRSENLSDLEKNIPRYMFKQKNNFASVFKKINKQNKNKIINLIFKTEELIRKSNTHYHSIGSRFLLNIKKSVLKTSV